ncbi:MAG: hypothetical protein LBH40_03040 [Alphaproteobacteria bacterium]|jgi:hypothetical protein|nr:hypothetical protein [Alphaproteobacteria bacterium]
MRVKRYLKSGIETFIQSIPKERYRDSGYYNILKDYIKLKVAEDNTIKFHFSGSWIDLGDVLHTEELDYIYLNYTVLEIKRVVNIG